MTVQLLRANALALPLADDSVDLIVTSPPYFALRSYTDAGEHYDGQIGSEPTPQEFLDALIATTAEMVRVLKPSGSIWVNLGDKYSSGNGGDSRLTELGQRLGTGGGQKSDHAKQRVRRTPGTRPKSLLGLPWRYAIRCIDDVGLILREEVIWSKPNALPESITDRARRTHEQWFHFTTREKYYAAIDTIREPHTGNAHGGRRDGQSAPKLARQVQSGQRGGAVGATNLDMFNPLGRVPGSVWSIPSQPLTVPPELEVDHFAAFPMEWPRRIIRGWSPRGICTACGQGRRPVVAAEYQRRQNDQPGTRTGRNGNNNRDDASLPYGSSALRLTTITGEACGCDEPIAATTPGIVLDPFGGTGTTAMVADALGRHGISVDMSADYGRLAQWRTNDPGERAKALGVEKPAAVADGQLELLDLA